MTLPHDVARCTGRIKTAQTAFDMSDAPTPSRHYEFAHSCLHQESGLVLNRIRALRDIPAHGVKAGDLGGYVESEFNLEQGKRDSIVAVAQLSPESTARLVGRWPGWLRPCSPSPRARPSSKGAPIHQPAARGLFYAHAKEIAMQITIHANALHIHLGAEQRHSMGDRQSKAADTTP